MFCDSVSHRAAACGADLSHWIYTGFHEPSGASPADGRRLANVSCWDKSGRGSQAAKRRLLAESVEEVGLGRFFGARFW